MISKLKDYKDAWNDITSAYAEEQENLIAAQILGSGWETDILNGRLDVLDAFKNQYIDIQQAIVDAAWMSANEQVKAAKEAEKGASGSTSSAPIIDDKYTQANRDNGYVGRLDTAKVSHAQNFQKYGTGTDNAKKGLNLVGEDGTETYFDNHGHVAIVTEPTLIPMEGGEVVKNEKDTSKLLDSDNISTVQYGKAFADGTGKYKGLPKAEKNALVSEYGQTEMTVLPNGDTIITDEPTLMDLPKDTVIYNEEQTKRIIDNKVDVSGKAHADGTNDGSWIGADGHRYRPIQPGDRAWELQKAFEPFVDKILKGEIDIISNAVFEGQKQMEKWTKEITNNTAINNISNNNRPTVNIGEIRVICPGVTDQQVAEKLPGVLDKALDQKFSGFSNFADQWSRR